jgi:tetratricopeptide (TPR) repeat protein
MVKRSSRLSFALLVAASLSLGPGAVHPADSSAFETALKNAEDSLRGGNVGTARVWLERALERDPKSARAWDLRARIAEAVPDKDEQIFSMHEELRLSIAQKLPAKEIADLRARLVSIDPVASDLLDLSKVYIARLKAVADQYEKDKRPHSAIRVHKEMLALDPELTSSADAIQRLASSPDPSLAADAKPKDLLAGVSEEWIRQHDLEHATWDKRDRLERPNYITYTDSGYATLVRSAETMEQMNAFYRQFFHYGTEEDKHSVPRIELRIWRTRDEYLKLGKNPVEWSRGQFTGDGVETYTGDESFNDMIGVLVHEAAHQFVSMATGAAGWLNEGLASFFEGCRILPNGTVIMNLPANHRLFPLVDRLKKGWMTSWSDGIDPKNQSKSNPEKAPTFKIVLEDEYEWGPAWYPPTWAVVYFLYNYQDPVDGRFVYRAAFHKFIDKSSGRQGKGAVANFEKIVLADPAPPIKGITRPKDAAEIKLPKTCPELDEVWKDWLIRLKQEQNGEIVVPRPYLQWARYALINKDIDVAREDFEKGLVATPNDTDLLLEFSKFLGERKNPDRAAKLALEATRIIDAKTPVDEKALRAAERVLEKWDPSRRTLEATHQALWASAKSIVQRYADAHMNMMVMDLSIRMTTDLRVPGLLDYYGAAVKQSGKSIALWRLAYNEKNLDGWQVPGDSAFKADGEQIASKFRSYSDNSFDFQMLTLDTVTPGDYSLEAQVLATQGKVSFCGLVFGKKDASNFHGLMLFPGKSRDASDKQEAQLSSSGFIDLASSWGGAFKTWRHVPVATALEKKKDETHVESWHKLRIDVSGATVDCWFDGEYLATQEFASQDVLRGGFGLITGPGEARFSDVRYLSRHARDPAAMIERQIRMEKLEKSSDGNVAVSIGGSFLNHVPPFPIVKSWVQGKRSSWEEKGPVPQLLVFWSIQQNDLIPIEKWLGGLAQKNADSRLEIVSVVSPNDADAIAAYLQAHKFPGAVAVDRREKQGIGDTFTAYSLNRFNLPRVILLDIDAKVAWEGDPGFKMGEAHDEASESFLDTPLTELVEKRHLKELSAWLVAWREKGAPALATGDLGGAYELMKQAKGLPSGLIPEIDDAQKKLASLESAFANLKDTAAAFAQDEAEPAFQCLLNYAPVMKHAIDKNTRMALQPTLDAKAAKDWNLALVAVERAKNHPKPEEKVKFTEELTARLEKLSGRFPRELLADVQPALANNDLAALQQLFTDAPQRPQKWLVGEYLRW